MNTHSSDTESAARITCRPLSFKATFTNVLALSFACAQLAAAQVSESLSSPATWEPAYWDKMTVAIKDAQQRGDKIEAETLCFRAIPYVEAQAVKALAQYAETLEARKSDGAAEARVRADKLAKVKADQARGHSPSSAYLGFAPTEELYVYVGALQVSGHDPEAQAMRLLAAAYRRSQEVYVRRSILMRERKDPRGEC